MLAAPDKFRGTLTARQGGTTAQKKTAGRKGGRATARKSS